MGNAYRALLQFSPGLPRRRAHPLLADASRFFLTVPSSGPSGAQSGHRSFDLLMKLRARASHNFMLTRWKCYSSYTDFRDRRFLRGGHATDTGQNDNHQEVGDRFLSDFLRRGHRVRYFLRSKLFFSLSYFIAVLLPIASMNLPWSWLSLRYNEDTACYYEYVNTTDSTINSGGWALAMLATLVLRSITNSRSTG